MNKAVSIYKKIKNYNTKITVDGDKSISIRALMLAAWGLGKSKIKNLPDSEDVKSTINCLKKLGVQINKRGENYEIFGNGINSFVYKKGIVLNAGNSGTCARLILGLLIASNKKIKLTGDESLSKRDFLRIIDPLKKFGAIFFQSNKKNLPISILGSDLIRPIKYQENIGSAQCKSSVMLAALNAPGTTIIKSKKSRDHTELFYKFLKIPIKIKKKNILI